MALMLLAFSKPADAKLEGPCSGSVKIEGDTYDGSNDSKDNPILLPENPGGLAVEYEGGITVQNTNYLGSIGVVIGPATILVADWGFDENEDDVRNRGPNTYTLGSELDNIVGLYQVTGFHDADGGQCDLDAMVKIEGSPIETPITQVALVVTTLTTVTTVLSGVPKKDK